MPTSTHHRLVRGATQPLLSGKPPIALHFYIKMGFAAAQWPGIQYTSGF